MIRMAEIIPIHQRRRYGFDLQSHSGRLIPIVTGEDSRQNMVRPTLLSHKPSQSWPYRWQAWLEFAEELDGPFQQFYNSLTFQQFDLCVVEYTVNDDYDHCQPHRTVMALENCRIKIMQCDANFFYIGMADRLEASIKVLIVGDANLANDN